VIVDTIDKAEQNKYFAGKNNKYFNRSIVSCFCNSTINRSGKNMQQVYEKNFCNKFEVIGCVLYYVEAIVFLKLA
jgi:hypothetical protein